MSMKRIILLLAFVALAVGCKTEEIGRFNLDEQMIRFKTERGGFSFLENPDGGELKVPFEVVGYKSDVDRTAQFGVIMKDADGKEATNFPVDNFELVSAIVPAGELEGTLTIRFTPPTSLETYPDFGEKHVWLRTEDGGDFKKGPNISLSNRSRNMNITVSSKLVMPASWPIWQMNGLGHFSSAYYEFIIEATGLREFPIQYPVPGYDGPGMDVLDSSGLWPASFTRAWIEDLKVKLIERNERVGSKLLHDSDDDANGKEVIIGQWSYS